MSLSLRTLLVAVLIFGSALVPHSGRGAAPEPVAGNPVSLAAARIPKAEFGSEFWSLAARFDSGHLLFLELCISNVGLGDRNAALIGHWIAPDGEVVAFDQARSASGWELSEDGLEFVIGKVAFNQRGGTHRLAVNKEKLRLELRFPAAAPTRLAQLSSDEHGLDLLSISTPVEGEVTTPSQETLHLRGQMARTHRWTEGLESGFVQRRIELFTLDGRTDAYLIDHLDPNGGTSSWLVVRQAGQLLLSRPVAIRTESALPDGAPGFPVPESLVIEGAGVQGRVRLGTPLVRFDPLRDLPAVVRFAISPLIQWRTSWSPSPFELELTGTPAGTVNLRGDGMTNVTYFNALSVTPSVASPPIGDGCGDDCL